MKNDGLYLYCLEYEITDVVIIFKKKSFCYNK